MMSYKKLYTEKNIQKLISSSLKNEDRLDTPHKEVVLDMLLQKLAPQRKTSQTRPVIVIALFMLWVVITVLAFTGLAIPVSILDLIKAALGLSMLLIPVSSIVLIISKLKSHEKSIV
jgi:hypothetical protein